MEWQLFLITVGRGTRPPFWTVGSGRSFSDRDVFYGSTAAQLPRNFIALGDFARSVTSELFQASSPIFASRWI